MLRTASYSDAPASRSLPSRRVILAVAVVLITGLVVRECAYRMTGPIRFELNQQNTFYWGSRIVRGANPNGGPASWTALWRSYVSIYEADEAHRAPRINTLDYVPLRLLMAGVWVNYLNSAYGGTDPVTQWRPEFARSFAAFSMVMELAGAVAMFCLTAAWLRRSQPAAGNRDSRSQWLANWDRWELAAASASVMWLNPASIVDSHIWPHGQTWILPFYLFAILAMISNRSISAGILMGLGAMFKGQMLMVAPMLVLWRMFDRRWLDAVRVTVGIAVGIALIAWPWLSHGSMAWARSGFAAPGMYSDVLRKGEALNLPALLARHWHLTLHQHMIAFAFAGHAVAIELKSVLMAMYIVLLICCAWGIARQGRNGNGDGRFLVSIAAPWAVMFFVLGQMDERYLVWSACFSAAAVTVGWRSIAAHVALTWAGAATMIEFLLITKPDVSPRMLHLLVLTNPATWIVTAVAVATLVLTAMTTQNRAVEIESSAIDAADTLPKALEFATRRAA
jgi:hypothetical protein